MLHCPRELLVIALICAGSVLPNGVTSAVAADPTGDWLVADGVATIRVAQCNGTIWGAVAWEKEPGGRDVNNPDSSKKNRPTLGMAILIDMTKKTGVDSWEGQVYNAKDGQLYTASIRPTGPDQMEIRGCVLGFLCGGETWTRVGPPIPASPASSTTARPATATVGTANPKNTAGKGRGQADGIGDICLLPDVARLAH